MFKETTCKECLEQARLLGISGSVEAALRSKLIQAEADARYWQRKCEFLSAELDRKPV